MLHENIKRLRTERNMTQSQLADSLHVVRQTVSKWENGSSVPDALMLQQLAAALDTDINTLLDCPAEAAPPPPTQPSIAKFWLLFALFWGLYLCFAPTEQDVFDFWDTDINIYLSNTILILSQMRRYLAPSLLGAGIVFTLRSAVRLPFLLPEFVRRGMYIAGNILGAVSLIVDLRFVLIPYIGLNRTGITDYFWLHDNQWFFALWTIIAALLIAGSMKDRPSAPVQAAAIPPMTKETSLCLTAALIFALFILLTTPLHDAVTRYESFGPINNKAVAILWQIRRFFGFPLLTASALLGISGLLRERLPLPTLPMPRIWQAAAILMFVCGLYAALNCTMLGALPFPQVLGLELLNKPHWLVLWMSLAALLLHFSTKETNS